MGTIHFKMQIQQNRKMLSAESNEQGCSELLTIIQAGQTKQSIILGLAIRLFMYRDNEPSHELSVLIASTPVRQNIRTSESQIAQIGFIYAQSIIVFFMWCVRG